MDDLVPPEQPRKRIGWGIKNIVGHHWRKFFNAIRETRGGSRKQVRALEKIIEETAIISHMTKLTPEEINQYSKSFIREATLYAFELYQADIGVRNHSADYFYNQILIVYGNRMPKELRNEIERQVKEKSG